MIEGDDGLHQIVHKRCDSILFTIAAFLIIKIYVKYTWSLFHVNISLRPIYVWHERMFYILYT